MIDINVMLDKCTGCGLCTKSCMFKAIEIKDKKAHINENCNFCKMCISSCKFNAISCIENDNSSRSKAYENYSGIWVFGEQKKGVVEKVVFELLGEARKLANILQVPVSTVLIGSDIENAANEVISYGSDFVYMVEHPSLEYFNDETYTHIFSQLINDYKPEIILIGGTTYGRSIAPRIASKANTGLTADCIEFDIDIEKRLLKQTRPAFGGNLMATIVCPNTKPQIATVRPRVMKSLEPSTDYKGVVIKPSFTILTNPRTVIKEIVKVDNGLVNITDADIIVGVGRGIGDKENLKMVEEFAKTIGAAIGASRAIVDSGLIDYSHQIGQTGQTVNAKVYFALGISGAIQHVAGMSSSDIIIAINKDADAPIFKVANYGVVGDIMEVVPELIEEFKFAQQS